MNYKKAEKTKKKIQNTYLELIKDHKFDKITIKELIEKADISRSTFYIYYDGIYSLIEDIENTILKNLRNIPNPPVTNELIKKYEATWQTSFQNFPFDIIMPFTLELIQYVSDNCNYLTALISSNGDPYFEYRLLHQLTQLFNSYLTNYGLPPHYITRAVSETL